MKKTSFIILTLVASLTISLSSAQSDSVQSVYPPDFLFESEAMGSDTTKNDTIRSDSDRYYYQQTNIYYDYYYHSRFFNGLFRIFLPGRYYQLINQPGFVPRHVRSGRYDSHHVQLGQHPVRSSGSRRGGFGQSGVSHTQFN